MALIDISLVGGHFHPFVAVSLCKYLSKTVVEYFAILIVQQTIPDVH